MTCFAHLFRGLLSGQLLPLLDPVSSLIDLSSGDLSRPMIRTIISHQQFKLHHWKIFLVYSW